MSDEEKLTALERLENLLNEKEAELETLQVELDDAQKKLRMDPSWYRHTIYEDPKKAPNPELPIPRLEVRWEEKDCFGDGYDSMTATYSLVFKHFLGWTVFVPLGITKSSGALRRIQDHDGKGNIDLPFRDGAHFTNEMKQLKLPGFIIAGDKVQEMKLCSKCGRSRDINTHSNGRVDDRCGFDG